MTAPVLTVGELTRRIKDLLEIEIDRVWVSGEISSFKVHAASGHAYFNLKDAQAVLACVAWSSTMRKLTVRPSDGMRVRAFGLVSVYEPRGTYQLYVERLVADGEGALQAAFLELKRKLDAEGLFDAARKRALPRFPRRIGIVTSGSGAALQDMLRVFEHRWPLVDVVLRAAAVQGSGAADELARAVRDLDQNGGCDLLIIGRGGGSLEDLWPFNEEVLVRALSVARTPIVSAVGHEVDFTIADFVADVRAATPTHAAELATPDRLEVAKELRRDARALDASIRGTLTRRRLGYERAARSRGLLRPEELLTRGRLDLDRVSERLRRSLALRAAAGRGRLGALELRLGRLRPETGIGTARLRIQDLNSRLRRGWGDRQSHGNVRVGLARARLEALSPRRVLERGYGLVRRTDTHAILRSHHQAAAGDQVEVLLGAGGLRCRVEGASEELGIFVQKPDGTEP